MNELDGRIAGWRRELLKAGINSTATLDELESHLREEMENFEKAGRSEKEAFELAVSKMGSSETMRNEFIKLRGRSLTHANLVGFRRYAMVILFLTAVFTSPEIVTQVLVWIPLQITYEIIVWVMWYQERRQISKAN
ncbi:MAG: hypothetical protein JWN25_2527 [Verrucomicrobiales bacterium]|nr:hypothetical protein [Verrucomicrobiales bacterium]